VIWHKLNSLDYESGGDGSDGDEAG